MKLEDFNPQNLSKINNVRPLESLTKHEVYELQLMLDFLDYPVGALDGILGSDTLEAYKLFKKDTFQKDEDLIGPGSIKKLKQLLDKEKDELEYEDSHPKQPTLVNTAIVPFNIKSIDWSNFKDKISKYFTVGEVTRFDNRRIPKTDDIKNNILKLAQELDKVREEYGKPIAVTSWYRPPAINRSIGGAKFSQHLNGSAADIYPIGGNGREFENWLDSFWGNKALGYGQRSGRGFTHCDLRTGRIRWNY